MDWLSSFVAAAYHIISMEDNRVIVPHCGGESVVCVAVVGSRFCVPVNPDKYPDWKCYGASTSGHHSCVIANMAPKPYSSYYCECAGSPRYGNGLETIIKDAVYLKASVYSGITKDERDDAELICTNCREHN
jgi:hypothetical protein